MPPKVPIPPKSANPHLYHLSEPSPFWRRVRVATSLNPDISSGLPLQTVNRNPNPASRPEQYAVPSTNASDPAFNPYWKRDTRRNYPAPSVITQSFVAELLLASPAGKAAIPPPAKDSSSSESSDSSSVPANAAAPGPSSPSTVKTSKSVVTTPDGHTLPSVLEKLYEVSKEKKYDASTGKLPPGPPGRKYAFKKQKNAPDTDEYWNVELYA